MAIPSSSVNRTAPGTPEQQAPHMVHSNRSPPASLIHVGAGFARAVSSKVLIDLGGFTESSRLGGTRRRERAWTKLWVGCAHAAAAGAKAAQRPAEETTAR
eukprot:CAMPEP_0180137216 /NCGR_PEP_ID=MMETSP0986-20121125/12065_1 /TAXON_ID=697907 /ORGANISM="non described non described, Strain CCMP2293" /LENGTH=100 /DNA_ID=CAMNT_0022078605 /DNA_START=518 /DNA_END=820 /DNA_ORIENTATION=-